MSVVSAYRILEIVWRLSCPLQVNMLVKAFNAHCWQCTGSVTVLLENFALLSNTVSAKVNKKKTLVCGNEVLPFIFLQVGPFVLSFFFLFWLASRCDWYIVPNFTNTPTVSMSTSGGGAQEKEYFNNSVKLLLPPTFCGLSLVKCNHLFQNMWPVYCFLSNSVQNASWLSFPFFYFLPSFCR